MFLRDHLGNNRVMFFDDNEDGWVDPASEVLQETHVYPFGLTMTGASSVSTPAIPNYYLFTGKETQNEFGIGWIDFGARMYDASVGRWNGVDALAENQNGWTPYRYGFNNPLKFTDPTGNSESHYIDENGTYLGQDKTGTSDVRVVSRVDWNGVGGQNGALKTSGTIALLGRSTPLTQYGAQGGIAISESTANHISESKGKLPDPTVVNNSDNEAAYEVEDDIGKKGTSSFIPDGTAIKLDPGKATYIPIDGVKTIASNPGGEHEGQIFRVPPGGGTVTIQPGGEVSEDRSSGGEALQTILQDGFGRDYGWIRRGANNDNWGQLVRTELK